MPPRRQYTENEMMRMQQDAVARVREMQQRAQLSGTELERQEAPAVPHGYSGRNFRNWSTNPGVQRQRNRNRTQPQQPLREESPPQPEYEPEPADQTLPDPPAEEVIPVQNTTLVQDILDAIGLDDDRLLILGLLFILINAKADTTLILALIYLLI